MTLQPNIIAEIQLSDEARQTVLEILGKIPKVDADAWISKLTIRHGRIAGTYFGDIQKLISYFDFVRLYTALGYEYKPQTWQNSACGFDQIGNVECNNAYNSTCDPVNCVG